MKIIFGLVVIIVTLAIAGKQSENNIKGIALIFFVGILTFSQIIQIPDTDNNIKHNAEYFAKSSYYSEPSYRKRALTKEEAEVLRGTGYHNTKPGSSAENMELKAAQVKCKSCGYHSDNGGNSLCDFCQKEKRSKD